MDRLSILQLSLHGSVVGHLAGYSHGKNILLFDDEFRHNPERPTLSLITHPNFPKSEEILARDWSRHQRLHPLLSNLLPEGALRELLAHSLKTHIDHEFSLLAWLGLDLPALSSHAHSHQTTSRRRYCLGCHTHDLKQLSIHRY
ncbi:HipA N-terminal domain-containing protein [Halomonas sp. R57-5]|uniref:HipA N-terminal domain-containing protein n=1 Tax=Halomonas sp. R57-5 TaxID=1610576 RepID=UPI000A50A8FA|nr:HipA N-terminal domain-containing protein [Halomonas sp. R57-5]